MPRRTTILLDEEVYEELVKESLKRFGSARALSKVVNEAVKIALEEGGSLRAMGVDVEEAERLSRRLNELRAKLKLQGVDAALHELIDKLVDLGLEETEKLAGKFRVGEDPMLRLLEKPVDWGVKDASTRIDEALYGEQ